MDNQLEGFQQTVNNNYQLRDAITQSISKLQGDNRIYNMKNATSTDDHLNSLDIWHCVRNTDLSADSNFLVRMKRNKIRFSNVSSPSRYHPRTVI